MTASANWNVPAGGRSSPEARMSRGRWAPSASTEADRRVQSIAGVDLLDVPKQHRAAEHRADRLRGVRAGEWGAVPWSLRTPRARDRRARSACPAPRRPLRSARRRVRRRHRRRGSRTSRSNCSGAWISCTQSGASMMRSSNAMSGSSAGQPAATSRNSPSLNFMMLASWPAVTFVRPRRRASSNAKRTMRLPPCSLIALIEMPLSSRMLRRPVEPSMNRISSWSRPRPSRTRVLRVHALRVLPHHHHVDGFVDARHASVQAAGSPFM